VLYLTVMSAQQLSDNISPEMKQQMAQTVMNDPAVQEMVRQQAAKAGTDAAEALKDPAVQAKIMETCKEKFPQYAAMGADKMKEFCSDPEVQAKAQHVCGVVGGYIAGAGGTLIATVEQGPTGVRLLSFIAGCVSSANCIMTIINPAGLIFGTVGYVLAAYQFIFAITTIMFEANPEHIAKVPGLHEYQDILMDKAKFLSETRGRGAFYIFQGTLWACFASFTKILDLAAAVTMIFVGILNILMFYNKLDTVVTKVKEGYSKVPAVSSA